MASLTSLQKRYERCIENDDFYGAEQACRMMHHRLTQSKSATPEDIERARNILQTASVTLLQKNQIQAGAALGLLVVNISKITRSLFPTRALRHCARSPRLSIFLVAPMNRASMN